MVNRSYGQSLIALLETAAVLFGLPGHILLIAHLVLLLLQEVDGLDARHQMEVDVVDCLACVLAVLQEDLVGDLVDLLQLAADFLGGHEEIDALYFC